MKYLLDTCVLSEFVKNRPCDSVVRWLHDQNPSDLYISCVTVGELEKGIAKRGGDVRGKALERWLAGILRSYDERIVPLSKDIAIEWGRICGEGERVGRPRPAWDSLIAATASVEKMKLVTRNVADFAGFDISIFNPFN